MALESREGGVNSYLAESLDLQESDSVIIRLQEPGMLSRDAPLSGEAEDVISFRAKVRKVVGPNQFGRFNLQATQLPVPTIFVPLNRLQQVVEQPGRANLLLVSADEEGAVDSDELASQIRSRMALEDYGLSIVDVPLVNASEVRSSRIFFEDPIVRVVQERFPAMLPVTSYLINTYAANGKETPYSMVAAVRAEGASFLPQDMKGEDIVVNEWLAEDLDLESGQELSLSFFKLVLQIGSRIISRKSQKELAFAVAETGEDVDEKRFRTSITRRRCQLSSQYRIPGSDAIDLLEPSQESAPRFGRRRGACAVGS